MSVGLPAMGGHGHSVIDHMQRKCDVNRPPCNAPMSGRLSREIMHCESRYRTNSLGRLNQGVIGWLTHQHINGTPIKSHLLTPMTMTVVERRYINTPSVLHGWIAPYAVPLPHRSRPSNNRPVRYFAAVDERS